MRYILYLLCCLFSVVATGQKQLPVYSIEGEQVVYQFDVRDLDKLYKDKSSTIHDFQGIDIKEVVYSGNYQQWEKDDWTMHRVSRHHYQLRKDLSDFDDDFPVRAKYLISGDYWASPTSEPVKKPADPGLQSAQDIFLSHQKKVSVSTDGNVTFELEGFPKAGKVILSGSFNGWNENQIHLTRFTEGWKITLDMPPGIYEYKFIVDGKWIHDPANNLKVRNIHDSFNSILLVGEDHLFTLPGYDAAEKVILSGSFNSWNEEAIEMVKTPRGWVYDLPLPPGKHYYKYIVDGKWITDPGNDLIQKDRSGYVNSVLLIH